MSALTGHKLSVSVVRLARRWVATFVCPRCDFRGSANSPDEAIVRDFATAVAAWHLATTEAPDAA